MPRAKRSPAPLAAAESVGRRNRELRNQRGLTLADLAGRAGLSLAFLSRLERGAATMTIGNLVRITAALAVPRPSSGARAAAELLERIEPRPAGTPAPARAGSHARAAAGRARAT